MANLWNVNYKTHDQSNLSPSNLVSFCFIVAKTVKDFWEFHIWFDINGSINENNHSREQKIASTAIKIRDRKQKPISVGELLLSYCQICIALGMVYWFRLIT